MRVSLFIPCLVDAFAPSVGIQMARILQKVGVEVEYDSRQTCCGQPAFNTGYREDAEEMAGRFLRIFERANTIVVPSGSCCSMVKVFYPDLVRDPQLREIALGIRGRIFEFSEFLVNVLGVERLDCSFPHRVTYHDSCHLLRELKIKDPPRRLLRNVGGIDLVEMEQSEECCGFGGTFSMKFPEISTAMGLDKIECILKTGAEFVVANDTSCLLHLEGLLKKRKLPLQTIHLADLLGQNL